MPRFVAPHPRGLTGFCRAFKTNPRGCSGVRLPGKLMISALQQPALGALTFLRSFVAGRANFCSHLLASLVHFTVVKSQAILSIPASWGHRSYLRSNFISSASFKTTKISTSLDMFRHNNFACGLCISIVALTTTM